MPAPSNRRSDKEIIDAIIKKAGRSIEPAINRSIEPVIKQRIADLRELPSPFTGKRRDNKDYTRDLINWIDEGKQKLTRLPWPLSIAVTDAEFFDRILAGGPTGIWINPRTRLIAQKPSGRTSLITLLDGLRARCEQLQGLGLHGLLNEQKLNAAIASRELLEYIAGVPTGEELSLGCRRDGKFCEIAALFFEAMTGKLGADLRRQCEHVAAPVRANR